MSEIGLISTDRLLLIPEQKRVYHEFCFFVHDQLVEVLKQYEEADAHFINFKFKNKKDKAAITKLPDDQILDFLKANGYDQEYKRIVMNQVIMALTSDALHFIYEALRCVEKRKITVSLSLLRKPLKENLFYLCWILANENEFLRRFERENFKSLSIGRIDNARKLEVFKNAIKLLPLEEAFDANLLLRIIYSKQLPGGFEPVFQKSTHLITSKGDLLKTEDLNFNMIFRSASDDDIYDFLFEKLPYVLVFFASIELECFKKIHHIDEQAYSIFLLKIMGVYESLFLDGRSQKLARSLVSSLKEFFKCVRCGHSLQIRKGTAPIFFIFERIECRNCGVVTEFPLSWFLNYAKVTLSKDQT